MYQRTYKNKIGFNSGQIEDMNLLNDPLSCGDEIIDENEILNDLVNESNTILKHNIIHNP
jgi:hypothetical protein